MTRFGHARVEPRRIRLRSETMHVDVLSTIGHRATCPRCPYIGPTRDTRPEARADARAHHCTGGNAA